MKKLFVLLLAVLVVGSIALAAVACGEDEETSTTAKADALHAGFVSIGSGIGTLCFCKAARGAELFSSDHFGPNRIEYPFRSDMVWAGSS